MKESVLILKEKTTTQPCLDYFQIEFKCEYKLNGRLLQVKPWRLFLVGLIIFFIANIW